MKQGRLLISLGVCLVFSACLFGCGAPSEPVEPGAASSESSSVVEQSSQSSESASVAEPSSQPSESASVTAAPDNMVDERFELLSLVFRLAGREEYCDDYTDYQKNLASEFEAFKEHDAVKYAAKLPLGYDAVFNFSVHIQKNGEQFQLIDDIDSLVEDGRWTRESAAAFLELLNGFYKDTEFSAFYQSNLDFYKDQTKLFVDNSYSEIDLAWFSTYVDPDNLRCIYSPATSQNNYGATVNGTIVYCAVSGEGGVIVHEYCHSFANPIAHKWYEENPAFKKWCDDTIDPKKLPSYGSGEIIAGEYVTRAYNTLYYAQHGYALAPLLYAEKAQGFPYIEEVYGMITPHEKLELGDDPIKTVLGIDYEIGEKEQSVTIGSREIRWRLLSLSAPLPLFHPTEVGNVFGSSTDDVLYVENSGEKAPYLLIDLGETTFQGETGFRLYSRIPLE